MFESKILRQIAEKLKSAEGNCNSDPFCPYSYANKCHAPEEYLNKRKEEVSKTYYAESKATVFFYSDTETVVDWPCSEIIVINVVDPRLAK